MIVDLLPAIRTASSELAPGELSAPVLAGVSGGPDSLALLHALWRWRGEGGPVIAAVHVDHHLRPESADEARWVAEWCAERGIPFTGRGVSFDLPPGANIEQVAREVRYQCFAEAAADVGARVLALAHHADDQAETLLLHLLRGSGLAGLLGMPTIRRSGDLLDPICAALGAPRPTVWRPLLAVRRATIVAYCDRWQLAPIHDPSNDDVALRRNAIRHRVMPVLERYVPGAGGNLARAAALLAADDGFLQIATEEALARCAERGTGQINFDRAAYGREHSALQRRMLRAAWGELRAVAAPIGLDAETVDAARAAILNGKTGSRHDLPAGVLLIIDRASAALGPADTLTTQLRRRLGLPVVEPGWNAPVRAGGVIALESGWSIEIGAPGARATPERVLHIPADGVDGFTFRTWQPGDRIPLPGGRGSRKLQDWFTDRHIPAYARQHLPLLACGKRILWIAGLAAFPTTTPGTAGAEHNPTPFPPHMEQPPAEVSPELGGFRGTIALRLLYNGTPVEPVRRH